jgi:short-subunit dehydrogenase
MDVSGRTVLLTGASGGLGQAIAERLADAGALLLLSARRAEVLEPLAQRLGGRALPVDLTSHADIERLVRDAGDVDVLVANAGLPGSGRLDGYDVAGIDRVLEVNLRAPIVLARLLVPGMVERGSGHVVFMSSLSGKTATVGQSLYSATKFGLRGFATGLRADLHGTGVGVSTVFPGFIRDAGMFADAGITLPRGVGTNTPDEVADAVLKGIERDRAELDVAPAALRAGAVIAGIAPELAAKVTRRLGGAEIASQFEEAQAPKR